MARKRIFTQGFGEEQILTSLSPIQTQDAPDFTRVSSFSQMSPAFSRIIVLAYRGSLLVRIDAWVESTLSALDQTLQYAAEESNVGISSIVQPIISLVKMTSKQATSHHYCILWRLSDILKPKESGPQINLAGDPVMHKLLLALVRHLEAPKSEEEGCISIEFTFKAAYFHKAREWYLSNRDQKPQYLAMFSAMNITSSNVRPCSAPCEKL
jgi:hypothetical protein